MKNKVFNHCITVRGDLCSDFVFETPEEVEQWVEVDFPDMEKQYKNLQYFESALPGLKVGDSCNVIGESTDVFLILDIVRYSKNRFGFVLDSGVTEGVAKCHTDFLPKTNKCKPR